MARFWITPDEDQAAQAGNVCSSAGLEEYDRIPLESIHGATYRKRRLSNQNLVSLPSGEFAASTGTFIYDGEVGKEALLSVLEDFTGDITEVQKKALGHYSLLISTGCHLYVFCDPEQGSVQISWFHAKANACSQFSTVFASAWLKQFENWLVRRFSSRKTRSTLFRLPCFSYL